MAKDKNGKTLLADEKGNNVQSGKYQRKGETSPHKAMEKNYVGGAAYIGGSQKTNGDIEYNSGSINPPNFGGNRNASGSNQAENMKKHVENKNIYHDYNNTDWPPQFSVGQDKTVRHSRVSPTRKKQDEDDSVSKNIPKTSTNKWASNNRDAVPLNTVVNTVGAIKNRDKSTTAEAVQTMLKMTK